jgi:hypothetical protein
MWSWADANEPITAKEIFDISYSQMSTDNSNYFYFVSDRDVKVSSSLSKNLFYSLEIDKIKKIIYIQDLAPSSKMKSPVFPKGQLSKITKKYN